METYGGLAPLLHGYELAQGARKLPLVPTFILKLERSSIGRCPLVRLARQELCVLQGV